MQRMHPLCSREAVRAKLTINMYLEASPRKNKCKKAKWLSEKALQRAEKRREVKGKGEKGIYKHLNAAF